MTHYSTGTAYGNPTLQLSKVSEITTLKYSNSALCTGVLLTNTHCTGWSEGTSKVFVLHDGRVKETDFLEKDRPSHESVEAWQDSLKERGLPLGVRVSLCFTSSFKLAGTITLDKCISDRLMNADKTSKVVVLKDMSLLEVRRGNITFSRKVKKTIPQNIWGSVAEWKEFLLNNNMDASIETEDGLVLIA